MRGAPRVEPVVPTQLWQRSVVKAKATVPIGRLLLKPREDVECESDSSQESRPMSPKREKKSAAEMFDYNSSQESKVPFLIPRRYI